MKRAETYLKRETTTTDNHDVVLKDDVSYSREILTFKIKLTQFKVVQTTVTTTQGSDRRIPRFSKLRRDGGGRKKWQLSTRVRRVEIVTRVVREGRRVIWKENKG